MQKITFEPETEDSFLTTVCPHRKAVKTKWNTIYFYVGSIMCQQCPHFKYISPLKDYVLCSFLDDIANESEHK